MTQKPKISIDENGLLKDVCHLYYFKKSTPIKLIQNKCKKRKCLMSNTRPRKTLFNMPNDVFQKICSNLAIKEIAINSSVSKQFNNERIRLFKELKSDQYFSVGNPIVISSPSGSAMTRMRNDFSNQEIECSFPKDGPIKLFKTKQEAISYAKSVRDMLRSSINDELIRQPFVFEVSQVRNADQNKSVTETLTIFLLDDKDQATGPAKKQACTYLETHSSNVVPLRGYLCVQNVGVRYTGFNTLHQVTFNSPSHYQEHKGGRGCALM
jgi:hypothetical protein